VQYSFPMTNRYRCNWSPGL